MNFPVNFVESAWLVPFIDSVCRQWKPAGDQTEKNITRMKTFSSLWIAPVIVISLITGCSPKEDKQQKLITPVKFSDVAIDDSFWSPRLQRHKDVTLGVCIDQIENRTGRIRNFENAAKGEGGHSGIFFDDSDVYKALEGMAYSLQNIPDPVLEAKCDEWIDKFAAAQQPDGYINYVKGANVAGFMKVAKAIMAQGIV